MADASTTASASRTNATGWHARAQAVRQSVVFYRDPAEKPKRADPQERRCPSPRSHVFFTRVKKSYPQRRIFFCYRVPAQVMYDSEDDQIIFGKTTDVCAICDKGEKPGDSWLRCTLAGCESPVWHTSCATEFRRSEGVLGALERANWWCPVCTGTAFGESQ